MPIPTKSYSITQYLKSVKNLISNKVPPIWIHGVLTQIKEQGALVYLSIAEFNPNDVKPVATLSLYAFRNDYNKLKLKLSSLVKPFALTEQTKVSLFVQADFYIPYGKFQSKILDIDPSYTLRELALTRERILQDLKKEGLLRKNAELEFPLVPLQIGLITSENSAAHRDFISQLQESPFQFKVFEAFARMQGNETENSILEALGTLRVHEDLDVVCIIRGGGSKTDLNYFDSEALCRAIALFPKPVLTGIGHEIDQSLVDLVAWYACITPAACAKFLIEKNEEAWFKTQEIMQSIKNRITKRLPQESEKLLYIRDALLYKSTQHSTKEKEKIKYILNTLQKTSPRILKNEYEILIRYQTGLIFGSQKIFDLEHMKFKSMSQKLALLDPKNILKKGYTLSYNAQGEVLKSAHQLKIGEVVETQFHDGKIKSTVN